LTTAGKERAAKAKKGKEKAEKAAKARKPRVFTIDLTAALESGLITASQLSSYLQERIKVNGKTGKLGDHVKVTNDKSKVQVTCTIAFSKRYLKYLTKRFLKKNQMRDFFRVVATDRRTYVIKYFNIGLDESGSDDEEATSSPSSSTSSSSSSSGGGK